MASLNGLKVKTMFRKNTPLITLILLIALAGCTQEVTEQPNILATATVAPTEYLISTPTVESTYHRPPIPTLSSSAEIEMTKILKSNDCNLPCYMGIVPGKTKLSDAKLLMDFLGATNYRQTINGKTTQTGYAIRFDDPSLNISTSATKDQTILYDLGLTAIDNVVQQISIRILARGLSPKVEDYWSRYSPKGIFLQVGKPDAIYTVGGALALVYERLGIINLYDSFWKDGQLCPKIQNYAFDRRFELTNKDSPLEIPSEHENALKLKGLWQPVEESLGVSTQEFYNQVIADDSVCFDIKIK